MYKYLDERDVFGAVMFQAGVAVGAFKYVTLAYTLVNFALGLIILLALIAAFNYFTKK